MQKLMNEPENYVQEMIEGIIAAHPDQMALLNGDFRVIVRAKKPEKPKVGIVTAGGSGHLPLFLGYVGEGLIDGCAVGDVFASPSSEKMANMIRACDLGKGVLLLYGNYTGDILNFRMAADDVEFDEIKTAEVIGRDDCASAPPEKADTRRGVAGLIFGYKIAGAAAEAGYSLDQVVIVTERAFSSLRTMGVAMSPCVVPTVGRPTFSIEEGKIELGMGIHGEAGIELADMLTADEVTTLIFDRINTELKLAAGDRVTVMVNGLGATPLDEQYIVYRKIAMLLGELDVEIVMPHIGEFATSMEMSGLSISIMKLDEELEELLKAPAKSPFYTTYNM